MKVLFRAALFSMLIIFVGACEFKMATLYDANKIPIPVELQDAPSDEISDIILTAGIERGWQMKKEGPGKIMATLLNRDHKAVVDIIYTKTNYSILYDSSVNLRYDGTRIHRNYNRWVKNLEKDISKGLNLAALRKS
ncbi:MAG: hypothetical protein NXI13_00835 [Proteobacteria bacterium]|nr:hypothetical protein [Pseudomonadota bacterium]